MFKPSRYGRKAKWIYWALRVIASTGKQKQPKEKGVGKKWRGIKLFCENALENLNLNSATYAATDLKSTRKKCI